MNDERRLDRMAGCACLGKGMLAAGAVAAALFCLLHLNQCFFMTDSGGVRRQVRATALDLRMALEHYKADYHRFPVPEPSAPHSDLALRSRGRMLPVLSGKDVDGLNPKQIKFIDFPAAKDRKSGLWKDDAEWVLSDRWGEPFYIILDTNGDGKIANPEYAADRSDKEYAKLEKHPSPTELPLGVIVYSAGKDRDPKTWHDNICSWRSL